MPAPHRKTSRAAERRKRRRQQREAGDTPSRTQATPKMAPLSLDPRRQSRPTTAAPVPKVDRATEYAYVRRDLWRLTIFSVVCFVLMVGALLVWS